MRADRFNDDALSAAQRVLESAGAQFESEGVGDDAFMAWIDDQFGGSWSSEAFCGRSVIVKRNGNYAGFASYDPRGLRFAWLRGLGAQDGVGIFGPFGVAAADRASGLGPPLLIAALASLRRLGYARALIPAVGNEKLIAYYQQHSGARIAERFHCDRWLERRARCVVMASGNGTNLQSVLDGIASGNIPLDISLVASNRTHAYATERARLAGIPALTCVWDRAAQPRERYDAQLLESIRREEPELILLLGWMHLLDDRFLAAFSEMLNIHPAFLPLDQRRDEVTFPDGTVAPAFRGANGVRDAFVWGSRWIGASCHRVTSDTDRGPVLIRKPLRLLAGQDQQAALARLHPLEHQVLHGGIMRWVYER